MKLVKGRSYLKAKRSTFQRVFNSAGFSFVTKNIGFMYLGAGTVRCSCSRPVPSFSCVRERLARHTSRFGGAMFYVRTHPLYSRFGGGITGIFRVCIHRFPNLRFYAMTRRRQVDTSSIFSSNIVCCKDGYVGGHDCLMFAVGPSNCSCRIIRFWFRC